MTEKLYAKNAAYQRLEALKTNRKKRYQHQEFLVEGVRNMKEAIQNGWQVKSFLYSFETPLSAWGRELLSSVKTECNYEMPSALMQDLSGKDDASELILVAGMKPDALDTAKLSKNTLIALFDRPSNKGNLGTIIRSCDALGVEALILTGHAVDLYDPAVITSTMGSFFHLNVVRMPENQMVLDFIAGMKKRLPTFQVIGTTAHKEHPLYDLDLTLPTLFLIGNETDGLCHAFQDSCDILGTIPMAETSYATSFNVGCAATVMFYEAVRQRTQYHFL